MTCIKAAQPWTVPQFREAVSQEGDPSGLAPFGQATEKERLSQADLFCDTEHAGSSGRIDCYLLEG